MLTTTYLPWLLAMAVPFILSISIKQSWRKRPLFIALGLVIAFVVCIGSIFLAGLVLTPLYQQLGLSTLPTNRPNETPTYMYLNASFYLLFCTGVTYWMLRQLASFFKAP
jgi:hypothetical protein